LIASRNLASFKSEKRQALTVSIFFVTLKFGFLSYIAMSFAPKAVVHGMLTFLEIIVVLLVVMSLAAIAALNSLGARKRNRPLQNSKVLCLIGSASDLHAG
jgi:hypothetical protein